MEVKIPLSQGLWHRLPRLDHHLEQIGAMAQAPPELPNGCGRTQRGGKHALTMELVQPSTIKAIGLRAARDMRGVTGVDQGHRTATRRQNLQQRHPVDARRCHHARGEPTGRHPVGEAIHSTGTGTTLLERWDVAVCWHTAPMRFSSHIEACGMGRHEGHACGSRRGLRTFVSHRCRQ